ncbi:MAG: transcription elongation factor GreA [Candidatus Taylorbacteria bacterium RIFCSPHIGHO2_02_FULL_46_13]|uniref:Transcription elongation factor GreA n=1 Tax=Candidatus Taylorbacteria bacterium RIFCSPHIGHO2_02_FULL_46_13 TaxID=1802312 RepID=A0A1G2MPV2_9BACT|nr:MAG: transcription elongation factor GreA [Candidatus Taylorbacteria bacterium RIFCSPHIGHO2_02_FULL_46_13]
MQESEYLTKEKFEELQKELESLKTNKRKEVAESLEYAKGLGDLSENAEYHEAREMQANVEDRIAKLESILQSAVIVSEKHGGIVGVGSIVALQKEKDQSKQTFTLVGSEEVDVPQGKISIHSPLGSALIGKRKGERVEFKSPSGLVGYHITEVK